MIHFSCVDVLLNIIISTFLGCLDLLFTGLSSLLTVSSGFGDKDSFLAFLAFLTMSDFFIINNFLGKQTVVRID